MQDFLHALVRTVPIAPREQLTSWHWSSGHWWMLGVQANEFDEHLGRWPRGALFSLASGVHEQESQNRLSRPSLWLDRPVVFRGLHS